MYLGNLRNRPNTSLNAKSVIKRIVRGLKERQVLWQEGSLSIVYMPMDDSRTACNRKLRQLYLVIRKYNGETSVSSRALIIRSPKEPTGYMPANAFSTEEAALA
jgi:hypothetical protein